MGIRSKINILELMLTYECHWGCADCLRCVDKCYPKDSHLTIDQIHRLIEYLRSEGIWIATMKITGGEPLCNPNFEEIVWILWEACPDVIGGFKLATSYSKKVVRGKYKLPGRKGKNKRAFILRGEPQTSPGFKSHHSPMLLSPIDLGILDDLDSSVAEHPLFVSPVDLGIIKDTLPDEDHPSRCKHQVVLVPPFGSYLTKRQCGFQYWCGSNFDHWGFTSCPLEATLGRLLGIDPYKPVLKKWAEPEICQHCKVCLGSLGVKVLHSIRNKYGLPAVTETFREPLARLPEIYEKFVTEKEPW